MNNTIEISNEDAKKYLYRYTGCIDIGNHNTILINQWIFSEVEPDIELFEEYNYRFFGGHIEKMAIPYQAEDDRLYFYSDEIIFWINDIEQMENDAIDCMENHYILGA